MEVISSRFAVILRFQITPITRSISSFRPFRAFAFSLPRHLVPAINVILLYRIESSHAPQLMSSCAQSQEHVPPHVISSAARNLLFPMSEVRPSKSDSNNPNYVLFLAFALFALSRFPFPVILCPQLTSSCVPIYFTLRAVTGSRSTPCHFESSEKSAFSDVRSQTFEVRFQ